MGDRDLCKGEKEQEGMDPNHQGLLFVPLTFLDFL